MRNKIGTFFMVVGAAFVLGALSLFYMNYREARRGQESVETLLPEVTGWIEEQQNSSGNQDGKIPNPYDTEMTEVEIDGYTFVGYLLIPDLGLELPVLSDCDDALLKVAPCRYAGSVKTDNLVIAAHNYGRHFGRLSQLSEGDPVIFTDMDGKSYSYEVAAMDILESDAVEEMTAGEYDLTLYTCTYSGEKRVTVRCERAE